MILVTLVRISRGGTDKSRCNLNAIFTDLVIFHGPPAVAAAYDIARIENQQLDSPHRRRRIFNTTW